MGNRVWNILRPIFEQLLQILSHLGTLTLNRSDPKWGPYEDFRDPPYHWRSCFSATASMKRKAEASSSSLRDIYDTTMRESGVRGAFSFRRMESTMQKRRRLNQPPLPRTVAEAAEVLSTADMSQQSYALNYL